MTKTAPPANPYETQDRIVGVAVWALALLLFAVALQSCSVLGIATEEHVAERIEAQNDRTAEAAGEVAQTFEPLAPGFSAYVEETLKGRDIRPPPPPPEPGFPWLEIVSIVGAAVGVSVPAAVKATNVIRDNRRVSMGEPTKAHPIPEIKTPEAA